MKTDVIFLVNEYGEDYTKEVYGYFPDLNADLDGNKTCYAHLGQHSACHPDHAKESREAKLSEYAPLRDELIHLVGYKLNILNKEK